MNNYLPSILTISIFCYGIFPSYVLAEPINASPGATSQDSKNQLVLLQNYLSAASNQMQKLSPQPQESNSKNTKNLNTVNAGPIPIDSINNLVKPIKKIVYDPDHPSEFIGKLIAAYSFYLTGENLALSYGQSFLGKKNQIIVEGKKMHNEHRIYLEALKQQQLTLEHSETVSKTQPVIMLTK